MNRAKTARWVTRFVGLAVVIVAVLALKIMAGQLRRIGDSVEGAESRASRAEPPAPPSTRLPVVPLPGESAELSPEQLDSKRIAPREDASKAAREESLPEPGRVPEGAVW